MLVISVTANGFRATENCGYFDTYAFSMEDAFVLFIEDISMKEGIFMKAKISTKLLAVLMCVAFLLSLCACGSDNETVDSTQAVKTEVADPLWENAVYTEDVTLGEGETTIDVVVEAGEKSIVVTINTDAKNLEDAITGVDLVQGDQSEYGLFIKVVNGITADYDVDQSYWSINKNGEYMMSGAKDTEIADGDKYELVYTK